MPGLTAFGDANAKPVAGRRIELVVIGASAGGIQALRYLLAELSANCSLTIVVVLHIPEAKESRLAEVFQHHCAMAVSLAQDKAPILPGHVYFAGPGYHLLIERGKTFSLSGEEPVNYSRPSIDVLMAAAADAYGPSLAGILLTGANHDGAAGMRAIHRQGGLSIVQDPTEAEIATMPQAALELFSPDFVLPLADIRKFLLRLENPQCNA